MVALFEYILAPKSSSSFSSSDCMIGTEPHDICIVPVSQIGAYNDYNARY